MDVECFVNTIWLLQYVLSNVESSLKIFSIIIKARFRSQSSNTSATMSGTPSSPLRWLAVLPVLFGVLFVTLPQTRDTALNILASFSQQRPTVKISQGNVVGTIVDDDTFPAPLEGFMGIPYALPPLGELRFRHAVPVADSNGTIQAFQLGPRLDVPFRQLFSFLLNLKFLQVFRPFWVCEAVNSWFLDYC